MTDLGKTLTQHVVMPPQVPEHRRETKVRSAMFGAFLMLVGVAALAFAGFLGMKPDPIKWLIGGAVGVAACFFAVGGLVADRETFWPALVGLSKLAVAVLTRKPLNGNGTSGHTGT